MLLVVLLYCFVNIGFSITYPTFNTRFNVVIDTCINNVTIDTNDEYDDSGSMICRCGDYNVICFSYEENDCTGNVLNTALWGGCEQDSSTRYLYNITGCASAQENAASGTCSYFVEPSTSWTGDSAEEYANVIKPLGYCQDYNCGSNTDENSRSCTYLNDGENITYTTYTDYDCSSGALLSDDDYDYRDRSVTSPTYVDCSVTVTQYQISSTNYYCGSKNSKIKVSPKSSVSRNYMLESIDSTPQSIGVCLKQRNGFHEYSWKYECNDAGDMVYRQIYLGSSKCKGTYYIAQNYSNLNYTIVCDQKSASGKYGYYGSDCSDQNWDASWEEYPKLYGECVPFRENPEDTLDGSLYQDIPWQSNLRIVHTCAKMKGWDYEAHVFFATSDCTGDYLFRVDENGEYADYQDAKSYPCKNTARTKISGCSGGVSINRRGRELLD